MAAMQSKAPSGACSTMQLILLCHVCRPVVEHAVPHHTLREQHWSAQLGTLTDRLASTCGSLAAAGGMPSTTLHKTAQASCRRLLSLHDMAIAIFYIMLSLMPYIMLGVYVPSEAAPGLVCLLSPIPFSPCPSLHTQSCQVQ